jgi:ABC-type antimicrobial peptide transport system permease subunit
MVREGLILGLAGAAIGLALARASTHFLASMFHGVAPTDPFTFLIVLTLLMLATILGSFLTARRASRLDPLIVLRHE